jgi:hypothetical protein
MVTRDSIGIRESMGPTRHNEDYLWLQHSRQHTIDLAIFPHRTILSTRRKPTQQWEFRAGPLRGGTKCGRIGLGKG